MNEAECDYDAACTMNVCCFLFQTKYYIDTETFYLNTCSILLQNYIYFGNSQSPTVDIYNKTSFEHISSYKLHGRGGIRDIAMFASDTQPPATSKYRPYM